MPYAIEYNQQEDIIFVAIEGEFTFKDITPFLSDTIEIVRKENCHKIITDLRQGNLAFSTIELHGLPTYMEKIAKQLDFNIRHIKRAFIANGQLQDLQFYATTAYNHGLYTTGCQDMEEAKRIMQGK